MAEEKKEKEEKVKSCDLTTVKLHHIGGMFTVRDFVLLTGISRAGFYLLVDEGKAPKITKIGERTRILKKDYEQWLSNLG